ncbi:MAG TPA: hypothetical protein VGD06_04245 [Acidobacteriota bacterium]
MQHSRLADKLETPPQGAKELDRGVFTGAWINSNPDTAGFRKITFATGENGELECRAEAVGTNGIIDWGAAAAIELYAAGPAANRAFGFSARYDFGFLEVQIQGNLNKGLMVLATFNRFTDDSGRCDYFLREYFAATHDRFS